MAKIIRVRAKSAREAKTRAVAKHPNHKAGYVVDQIYYVSIYPKKRR